jgi:nicotinamidase-related amidase
MGSTGAAIVPALMKQVTAWARNGNYYDVIIKGTNPLTEHFGAFRANVPIAGAPETQLNTSLIDKLKGFDRILLAGEAKSHCVANSVKQLFGYADIIQKLVILGDCMSNVPGFEQIAVPIYDEALQMGAKIINVNEVNF